MKVATSAKAKDVEILRRAQIYGERIQGTICDPSLCHGDRAPQGAQSDQWLVGPVPGLRM